MINVDCDYIAKMNAARLQLLFTVLVFVPLY